MEMGQRFRVQKAIRRASRPGHPLLSVGELPETKTPLPKHGVGIPSWV
jgi:hypothetical protein